jgi:aryl carrier-like protein
MSEVTKRINELSADKRELLEMLLSEEGIEISNSKDNYVPPRTPLEETLAAIFGNVLKAGQVGIHNSFFELGGDSIQSIQIIAKVQQAGYQITTSQLFEHPTIAALADFIETTRWAAQAPVVASNVEDVEEFEL